jgi:hypothetical protein
VSTCVGSHGVRDFYIFLRNVTFFIFLQRSQIDMIRSIRVDHTKFLQVPVKTHSFMTPFLFFIERFFREKKFLSKKKNRWVSV